ncbi:MAG: hypothetical protein JWR05_720 [Mucilaginibacter sp.]|nr:hypothetical protein [Mucilaginibacter sp.]
MTIRVVETLPSKVGNREPVESCVIFIHGFAGSKSTWNTFSNHLFNQWTLDDSFGLEYDVHTIESDNPHIARFKQCFFGGPPIDVLSNSLNTTINEICRDYKNVIIIAHSMGGLIARQYLVDLVKNTKNVGKIRALITYATPHKGSALASWYKLLGLKFFVLPFYFITKQVVQMCRYDSSFIDKLNKDWDFLRIDSRIDFKRIVGERDFIVDRESAALTLGFSLYDSIANKGHFDIIRPKNHDDRAFMITYNYLKDFRSNLERSAENAELDILTLEEQEDEDADE